MRVYDRYFNCGFADVKLSVWQRLVLAVSKRVFVFYGKKGGWTGYVPFYIAKCNNCKCYFLDYPHGFDERLDCPKCNKKVKMGNGENEA